MQPCRQSNETTVSIGAYGKILIDRNIVTTRRQRCDFAESDEESGDTTATKHSLCTRRLHAPALLAYNSSHAKPRYYHTGLRDIFVGTMCVIGVFLFCYRRHDWIEKWTANVGCVSAVGVAISENEPHLWERNFVYRTCGIVIKDRSVHTVHGQLA